MGWRGEGWDPTKDVFHPQFWFPRAVYLCQRTSYTKASKNMDILTVTIVMCCACNSLTCKRVSDDC